ncbi:MAG TPA: hypothetical protein VKZ84_03820 [Bacteriovoracaceae bacterium]|nr:hypothetical protein [Bacteriovoracaceae bacterium]
MNAHNQNLSNNGSEAKSKISLDALAKLTGFPVEMIQEEVFSGKSTSEVSLEELRSAMLNYIDSTMLAND